jgi:hypothetical protein
MATSLKLTYLHTAIIMMTEIPITSSGTVTAIAIKALGVDSTKQTENK